MPIMEGQYKGHVIRVTTEQKRTTAHTRWTRDTIPPLPQLVSAFTRRAWGTMRDGVGELAFATQKISFYVGVFIGARR